MNGNLYFTPIQYIFALDEDLSEIRELRGKLRAIGYRMVSL